MSEAPSSTGNPFLANNGSLLVPAPDPGGLLGAIRSQTPSPDGILLSPRELVALQMAPRRGPGTEVTVHARPVENAAGLADHMFVEYDDGSRRLIARGEPSLEGPDFWGGTIDGSNRVRAAVTPAAQSKDYAKPSRVLGSRFLPNETAEQAALPALLHAQGVNRGGNFYGIWDSNSNSFAGDVSEPIFGRRMGDGRTPGYRTHLRDDGAPPPPLDLAAYLRYPAL